VKKNRTSKKGRKTPGVVVSEAVLVRLRTSDVSVLRGEERRIARLAEASSSPGERGNMPAEAKADATHEGQSAPELHQLLVRAATSVWRALGKLHDPDTGEVREESRRVHRHVEAIGEALEAFGVETLDPRSSVFDAGLPLKVISFEETPGLVKEVITETIKPSVRWRGRLLQVGEVIVGVPPQPPASKSENQ